MSRQNGLGTCEFIALRTKPGWSPVTSPMGEEPFMEVGCARRARNIYVRKHNSREELRGPVRLCNQHLRIEKEADDLNRAIATGEFFEHRAVMRDYYLMAAPYAVAALAAGAVAGALVVRIYQEVRVVERWVKDLTEEVMGGSPVEVGRSYVHPEHGPITIASGQYWGTHGLSNHWHWTVVATGEKKYGYGGNWPECWVTKNGNVLTEEDVQRLADEAEAGYDPALFRALNPDGPRRRAEGSPPPPPAGHDRE